MEREGGAQLIYGGGAWGRAAAALRVARRGLNTKHPRAEREGLNTSRTERAEGVECHPESLVESSSLSGAVTFISVAKQLLFCMRNAIESIQLVSLHASLSLTLNFRV